VKSDLNLPEGKSKNDTMVIIIPDGINNVVIEKMARKFLFLCELWIISDYCQII
jgi:hypothetical protein